MSAHPESAQVPCSVHESTTSLLSSERHAYIQQGSDGTFPDFQFFKYIVNINWPKALTLKRVYISFSVPDGPDDLPDLPFHQYFFRLVFCAIRYQRSEKGPSKGCTHKCVGFHVYSIHDTGKKRKRTHGDTRVWRFWSGWGFSNVPLVINPHDL